MTRKTPEERFRTGGGADFNSPGGSFDAESMRGRVIDDHRIKELIGEGGMARVYRAERTDGTFERDVAIKISHASTFSPDLRERFRREQHILASINHVNVASLYDAGVTEEGWPYIIMELVEGSEIDCYVASRELGDTEVVTLMLPVLEALAFAHARLIVHRDIKPSNIVITERDEPRLLDFGIAKLLEDDSSAFTGVRAMTLSSASPEQLLGRPITVASDVYQIGLLLHLLLTGRPALPERSLAEAINNAVAARPFGLDPECREALPRDLASIILHCLQVDPGQRYRDVNALKDDLVRFLEHRPISVSAPTLRYRFKKLVQRNRLACTVSLVFFLTLAGGVALYTTQVTKAREAAERQAAISQEAIDFLTGIFTVSDPGESRGSTLTARELLDRGAADLEQEFQDRPLIRARLQMVIGDVYRKLGHYQDAEPLYESALGLRTAELGRDHRDTLIAGNDLGIVYELQGRLDVAEALYLDTLARQRRVLGSDDVDTMKSLQNLGSLYHKLANYEQAAHYWVEALERRREVLGVEHPDYAVTLSNLPIAYIQLGDLERAQELFLEGLEVKRQRFGEDHPTTIGALANVGSMYFERAMYDKARPYLEQSWELAGRVLGAAHPNTLVLGSNLAAFYIDRREAIVDIDPLESAGHILDEVVETARRTLGDQHGVTHDAVATFAELANARGNHRTALDALGGVLDSQVVKFGAENRQTLATRASIAKTYAHLEDYERAVVEYADVVEIQAREIGELHPDRLNTLLELADAHSTLRNQAQAEALYRTAIAGFEQTLGDEDPQTLRASERFASALAAAGGGAASAEE